MPKLPGAALDHQLLILARTKGHGPARERAVSAFSRLGEHGAGWIALGLLGAALDGRDDPERRRAWLRGAGAVIAAYGANQAIKFAVRRPRPELPGLPALTSTVTAISFPSAHASTSFAGARAFAGLAPGAAVYGVAVALAASRPYLGVHYPSDVAAGAVLGTAVGSLLRPRTPTPPGRAR